MRKYEDKEKEIVTRRECVSASCDMCGRPAEHPQNFEGGGLGFEYCNVGTSGGAVESGYYLDGETETDRLDLCYECASWLIEEIKNGRVKRS